MGGQPKPKARTQSSCLVLACGALAREILALKAQLGLPEDAFTLQCLPAALHNRPALIAPRVAAVLAQKRHLYDRVLVGYGDCGTGGALDKVLAEYDAERLPQAHCYEFFAGSADFEAITEAEIGSFFLTDFLARHFERLVIAGLGLDRHPELRDAYFGHYRDVVYLAQTENPDLQARARAGAERLGLNYVYRFTGYGELRPTLAALAPPIPTVTGIHA